MTRPLPSPEHQDFIRQFVRFQPRIHAFIATLVPRAVDAEEILQETSIVGWQKYDQFTPGTDFVRWICTIARYEVFRYRRQKAEHIFLSDSLLEELAERQIARSDELELRQQALAGCLKQLRQRDRELFRRVYGDQQPANQVAAELNRPANTVYKALARIRRGLLACVQRHVQQEERS